MRKPEKPENYRARTKRYADNKKSAGFIKFFAWVKKENVEKIKKFIAETSVSHDEKQI